MIFKNDSVGTLADKKSVKGSDALSVFKRENSVEVLAPAGGPETVVAAVRAGADAVYFGAPGFNARRNAENFGRAEMEEAIRFCRVRGVKTYLTLNTLISDREMAQAIEEARFAYLSGIDAVIVQDLGLAKLLRKHLPDLPLHASTQMSVHSKEALPVLKKLGFVRVVPAREMDKQSLVAFCEAAKKLDIEVEVFVHGALCMCLSGQCYLSAMLGGRSGNRGLCAQPCRLQFTVEDGTGHDLSLKDMSVLSHIEELKEMGVCSLKIEGRMKRPEYVAAAVSVARSTVDGKEVSGDAKALLSGIFSRSGHTDGYFTANYNGMFGIRTSGDEKMSSELINTAHELYRRDRQSVAVKMYFELKNGHPASLTLSDNDGHKVTASGSVPTVALKAPVTAESVKEKLSKLGGTCYYLNDFDASIDDGLFIGGSEINALRREAVDNLDKKRSAVNVTGVKETELPLLQRRNPQRLSTVAYFRNAEQIPEDISGLSGVILPVEADFSLISVPEKTTLIADIPRGILHSYEKYKNALINAKENGVKAAIVGNLAGITLANEVGIPFIAGFGMNVFNSYSMSVCEDLGFMAAVASFELTADGIRELSSNVPVGAVTYGRLPLMIFKNCPGKNGGGCKECGGKCKLTDRKAMEFPVMCRGEFSEMYNSLPLWNFDRIRDMGLDFQLLYFTDETAERCAEVITAALNRQLPDCEYTRGLYYRGVQ